MPRTPYDTFAGGLCSFSKINGDNLVVTPCTKARFTESFSGTSRRKPKGFIAPTAYSFFHREVINAYGSWTSRHKVINSLTSKYSGVIGGGTGLAGRFNSSSHFDAAMLETASDILIDNRALIKARNKIKDADVNLGVAFAERSATARLVGDTAISIAKSYRHLRRGEIRRAMDALGISSARREPRGSNAPRKWLELQYGWKPLLSDIYGSCDALSKRRGSDWLVTAKGSAESSTEKTVLVDSSETGLIAARRTDSCYVRIDALPKNDATISLASLGITNPLLIGWELVPFSFVVDWFLPVGGYLESLDALLGYDTFGFSSSHMTRIAWDGAGIPKESTEFIYTNDWVETKRVVRLVRTVSNGVPFPHFPRFKDPRSLEHMANGLSLIAAAFGRR